MRPAYSSRACISLPHSHSKRIIPDGAVARAGGGGVAGARFMATVWASPQAGHLTRRPA